MPLIPAFKSSSLTARTLWQVAAAVTLILAATTAGAYRVMLKIMERQGLAELSAYASERAHRESLAFGLVEDNLAQMRVAFLERWGQPDPENAETWFDTRMERTAEGALQSRRELVDTARQASTWVRAGAAATPEMKRLVMVGAELCERYFPAWARQFPSLYASSPLEFNTGLALHEPDWVWKVEADFDQNSFEWGRAAAKAENPKRKQIWTGMVPDVAGSADSGLAFVTLCQPVDLGDRHVLTFHQDLELRDITRRTAQSERPGVGHVIFRRDGRLIASPRVDQRLIAAGGYLLQDSPDPVLRRLHAAASAHAEPPWAAYDEDSDCYVALSRLEGPDWIFASVMSGRELRRQAFASAQWVLWAGLGALALALPVLAVILKRQVARPLGQLLEMTERVGAGDTAARMDWRSADELGRVARAFNRMAGGVAERDASLQRLNQELERRIAERTEGLRQSEERFSRAFHGSHALLAILDAGDGRFLDVNESFLGTFGYSREEVIGKRETDLRLWVHNGQRRAMRRAYRTQGFLRNLEAAARTRAGGQRVISQSGDCVTIGSTRCILAVGSDITERKLAEVEMRRALERERELNQLKDNFVAMISHEFRTPLEIIITSTDILSRYLERVSPEQRARQLATIQGAVRRMTAMMDEVLLLGRAEAGRLPCRPEDVLLPAWCRRVVEEISAASPAPRDIRLELAPFPPMVMADEGLLRHILTNLLSNALKYSDPETPVLFAVRREGDDAVFTVRDHGVGIPAADRPHLFDGFHRGGNVGQRPGTGLGLVIARRCAELHGGAISFTSEEGRGTVFTVRLPLFRGLGDEPDPAFYSHDNDNENHSGD